jgi:hypothetical protein
MRYPIRSALITITAAMLLASLPAAAELPPDMSYQGQLLDAQGVPKTGTVNIQIRIYEMMAPVAGESPLFAEDHENVGLDNGIFSIRIGTGMPVSGTFGPELFNATNRYLQVHINSERLSPRQPIGSVPYSFQSNNAATLEGKTCPSPLRSFWTLLGETLRTERVRKICPRMIVNVLLDAVPVSLAASNLLT